MDSITRRAVVLGAIASPWLAGGNRFSAARAAASSAPPVRIRSHRRQGQASVGVGRLEELPVDGAARAAYVKRKAQTAYTQPQIAKDVRRKNAQLIASRGGMSLQEVLEKPIPGGFGYGFIYNYEPREPGSSSRSSAPTGPGGTWKLTPPGGPAASASAAGGR
jgi:hypothetical protein